MRRLGMEKVKGQSPTIVGRYTNYPSKRTLGRLPFQQPTTDSNPLHVQHGNINTAKNYTVTGTPGHDDTYIALTVTIPVKPPEPTTNLDLTMIDGKIMKSE